MADKKYDVESFLRNTIDIFKAKLNTKIDQINTEKGDGNIDHIDNAAWFVNLLNNNYTYNPFVIVGLIDQTPIDFVNEGMLSKTTLSIEIGLADKNWSDVQAFYRLLRYQRALEEVAYENSESFQNGKQPMIEKLPPALVVLKGNSIQFSGINITIRHD